MPRDLLAEILCNAEIGGALREGVPKLPAEARTVRYMPCPLCHASMNRVNFGRVSGVIIDVCKAHGTWFDAGELTRVVAFAAAGGLEKTRAREKLEKRDGGPRATEADVHLALQAAKEQQYLGSRRDLWEEFLSVAFYW